MLVPGGVTKKIFSFPYEDAEPTAHAALMSTLYTLTWGREGEDEGGGGGDGQTWPLGYMLSAVVDELEAVPEAIRGLLRVDRARRTVHAFEDGFADGGEPARSAAVAAVMRYWRERDTFEVLRGWRDELWPGMHASFFFHVFFLVARVFHDKAKKKKRRAHRN